MTFFCCFNFDPFLKCLFFFFLYIYFLICLCFFVFCLCSRPFEHIHRRPNHWFLRDHLIPGMYSSRGSRALRPTTDRLLLHPDLVNNTNPAWTPTPDQTREVMHYIHVVTLREAAESVFISEIVWEGNPAAASVSSCSGRLHDPPVSCLTCLTCEVILTCCSRLPDTTRASRLTCSSCRSFSAA